MKAAKLLACLLLVASTCAKAQRNPDFEAYISRYAPIAVAQMQQYGIPASITLAQGLLESGAGKSVLATKANNHFGIKTGGDWDGPYVLKDDDAPNERFRAYDSPVQSYEDHSCFLRTRGRYASLFSLSPTDYRAWARGLKAAGYATSPTYADRLIQIIETYGLNRYDHTSAAVTTANTTNTASSTTTTATTAATTAATTTATAANSSSQLPLTAQRIYLQNGAYYVHALPNDTYRTIGKRWGVRPGSLRRYNEQPSKYEPHTGERVYLVKKPSRAEKRYKGLYHIIRAGESLHGIAQQYAMRTRTLYRLNRLLDTYIPCPGDRLRLR